MYVLSTKLNVLKCNILLIYDYFVFTETMFSTDILDSKLEINCFNIFRNNRRSNTVPIIMAIS